MALQKTELEMNRAQIVEIIAIAVIALLVATGGRVLLETLGHNKLLGAIVGAGLVLLATSALRGAWDPSSAESRQNVTKAGAYFVTATLVLWAVLAPAKWVFGSCIAAAEVALVFDLITVAARHRVAGGN